MGVVQTFVFLSRLSYLFSFSLGGGVGVGDGSVWSEILPQRVVGTKQSRNIARTHVPFI